MKIDDATLLNIFSAYSTSLVKATEFTARQIGISFETKELVLRATGGVITDAFIHPIKKAKLILTPISKMTEADGAEIAKMFDGTKTVVDSDSFIQIVDKDGMVPFYWIAGGSIPIKLTDKLRELGYDCGYGEIKSLIKAGIAIEN